MTDPRVVEAVVQAVLAQLRVEEAACACHSVAGGCCPDRLGRMLGHGAERFGLQAGATLYPRDIARKIDHTLLKPEATREQIEGLCREAREHGFATVCINPAWVAPNSLSPLKETTSAPAEMDWLITGSSPRPNALKS